MGVEESRSARAAVMVLCSAILAAACSGKKRDFSGGAGEPARPLSEAGAAPPSLPVPIGQDPRAESEPRDASTGASVNPAGPLCDDDGTCGCDAGSACAKECVPGATLCDTPTTRVECGIDGVWTTPTTCPYACIGENCNGECVPGASECLSSTRRRTCGAQGTWLEPTECDAACLMNDCGGQCTPNQTRCISPTSMETCNDLGEWGTATQCGNACLGQSCTGECTPAQTRCFSETRQQTCSEQGQWQAPAACPNACIGASCGGECVPGTTRCNSTTQEQRCSDEGQWSDAVGCANACVGTICGGECVPGTRRCSPNTGAPQQCSNTGSWDSQTPCQFTCTGNGNCSGECMSGARRCGTTSVAQLCVAFQWQNQAACPSVCTGSGNCTGDCDPGSSATCGQIHGSQGECAVRNITCSPAGIWAPAAPSCTTSNAEICGNQRDDDCDGQVDEDPPCIKFVSVGAGEAHTCGLLSDGTVRCWGANDAFQTGSGGTDNVPTPRAVAGLTGVRQLSVGNRHSCALLAAQGGRAASVRCWGENTSGELGDGTTTNRATPVRAEGAGTAHVMAGFRSSCSLDAGGNAICWGRTTQVSSSAVTALGRVLDIFVAATHACALTVGAATRSDSSELARRRKRA